MQKKSIGRTCLPVEEASEEAGHVPHNTNIISVYVDSDAVRLYLAGKASVWHAGVLLAAPTASSR
jgi:hypothetical protein